MNGIYYTPYPNGQSNYYIQPKLAEYSIKGTGYGGLAAAPEDLEECETEWDMLRVVRSFRKQSIKKLVLSHESHQFFY